jgi:tripartite-type tricarboxylate transporter receptor subunit TctC
MKKTKQWVRVGLILGFAFIMTGQVHQVQSQEKYPTRPIEIIVPFGPGGSTDLNSRVIAAYLTKRWKVPVNVINKPGGNTVPACLEVYGAIPDGYTILNDSLPSASMVGAAVRSLPFKVLDRTFIGIYSATPLVFIVHTASPIKNLKDAEAEAKKSPETFTWVSMGGAGQQDFGTRQFLKAIGVDVRKTKPVMSQAGSQGASLTAGGHLVLGSAATSSALPVIRGGMVRAIAVASKERFPDLPDVPTTYEQGYPTVNALHWNGISGPPKLPSYIVEIWDKALQEMLKDPEAISKFKNVGAISFYRSATEMREYVAREAEEVDLLWGVK